jgi:23S rRNA G2069 N7-methylase RlmK/C1962 C5-methylase RlmI
VVVEFQVEVAGVEPEEEKAVAAVVERHKNQQHSRAMHQRTRKRLSQVMVARRLTRDAKRTKYPKEKTSRSKLWRSGVGHKFWSAVHSLII